MEGEDFEWGLEFTEGGDEGERCKRGLLSGGVKFKVWINIDDWGMKGLG